MTDSNPGLGFPFPDAPAGGEAIEIAPGVLWMRLPLPMTLDHVNVYALDDGPGWTLIDTGMDSRRTRALWEQLLAGPLGTKPVTRVLVTHHHPDHIGLAGWFQSRGAELLTTRTAWLLARMLVLDVQTLPTAEQLAFWRAAGVEAEALDRRASQRPFNFSDCVAPLPLGFTRIAEGDILVLGQRRWQVRFGQGHAPDHATLWSLDDALVIGGDQLLPGISPNIGVYATEPGADPLAEWIEACHAFELIARHDHLVLPGHKLPFTGLPLRLTQMIDNHQSALDRLRAFLTEPRRATDCFSVLFKRRIGPDEEGLALVEAVAHLNHLQRRGEASKEVFNGVWWWRRV